MPAIFAHWLLGEKVLENLESNEKKIILRNRKAFNLGLQGPDFMFFKDMGQDKEVFALASRLHSGPASDVLTEFTNIYKSSENPGSLAYILGFIGHFVLDTNCHWYVFKVVDEDGVDHNELETEFDRFLMLKEELKPSTVKVEEFISLENVNLKKTASLYQNFEEGTPENLEKAFADFYKFKKAVRILQAKTPFLIHPGLKILKRRFVRNFYEKRNKSYHGKIYASHA